MEAARNFLDLWLEIYQEAIQLCDAIDKLPDHCECEDADAHLEGRCPCCHEHTAVVQEHREDCTVLLTRLRADLTILCQDFAQLAAPIAGAAIGLKCLDLRRGIYLAEEDLHRIAKAVDRFQEEVVGFRRNCDLSALRSIKYRAKALREHFNQLNLNLTASETLCPPEG